jgi:hypothetical protein
MSASATKKTTTNVQGAPSGVHPALYVAGAAVVLGVRLATKTTPQALAAMASQHASRLAAGGAGLLFLLALLVTFDLRASSKLTYQPPSLRVRFARAGVVGLLTVLAVLAITQWLEPGILLRLIALGRLAAVLVVPVFGLGMAYDLACLRPPKAIHPVLPSFQSAAAALRETNDFLLGTTSLDDWQRGTGPQRWFVIPEKAVFTNLFAVGGIGSGKTATALKPILEQALYKFPADRQRKIGLFIIDGTKGSLTEHVIERARLAGRMADVIEIKPGGTTSYNPVGEGSATALANKLVAALEVMTAQESHSYYKKMQREFAENAFQILVDVLGPGKFTLRDLYDFVCDSKIQKKYLEAAAPKNSVSFRWFQNQWANEDPREQMALTKGFRADLSLFVRDELAPTFAVVNSTFPGWKSFIDDGKIVVFNMDMSTWGPLTRAMGIFLLIDFQRAMIARSQPSFKRAGGNTERLVLALIDEVWAFMNPGLAEFTAISRESRCCTFGLTQGLGQVPMQYRDTMIGNFRTAIVLAVQDPLTMETYSRLFGTHRAIRESTSESTGFAGVSQQVFTDSVRARQGGESRSVSISSQEVEEPRFSPTDLLHLQANSAAVLMFDGATVQPSRLVHLMPSYLPEFQLFEGK